MANGVARRSEWTDRASYVRGLATSPEGQNVEFKEQTYSKKGKDEYLKDVTSLANASGGSILVGVKEGVPPEPNAIMGLENVERELERLDAWAASSITPRIASLEVFQEEVFEKVIIVIQVPEGQDKPHGFAHNDGHQFWIRVGKRCQRMRRSQLEDCFKLSKRDSRRFIAEALKGEFLSAAKEFRDFKGVYAEGREGIRQLARSGRFNFGFDQCRASYLTVTRKDPSLIRYTTSVSEKTKWKEGHWVCLDEQLKPVCVRDPGSHGCLVVAATELQATKEFVRLSGRAALIARDCADFGPRAMPHASDLNWHSGQENLWYALLVEEEISQTKTFGMLGAQSLDTIMEFDPETDPFTVELRMNPFYLSALLLDHFIEWLK